METKHNAAAFYNCLYNTVGIVGRVSDLELAPTYYPHRLKVLEEMALLTFEVYVCICKRIISPRFGVLFKLKQLKVRQYIDKNRLGESQLTTFKSHQFKTMQVYFSLYVQNVIGEWQGQGTNP